ncbi:hypothetical protein VTH06DRAFT_3947 [Thermothelomyces fergusii]
MFCLRSWLPLLFIPTNASPAFIFLFFLCTYFLNRPCFYCSFLLLILFLTSCNWSDRCFLDVGSNWFQPRLASSHISLGFESEVIGNSEASDHFHPTVSAAIGEMLKTTAGALATTVTEQATRVKIEWTGLGLEWLRSLIGRREWRIDCLDLYIRL